MAKRKTNTITGYRYTGGAYIHGVPARDMTPDEYDTYAAEIEQQQALINMVLYEPVMVSAADEEVTP